MTTQALGPRLIGAARNQAVITIVITGALFIAQAGVARRFGGSGLGEYIITSLSVYIAGALAAVAIPVTVSRDAAYLEERQEHAAASRLVGVGLSILLVLASLGGVALAFIWDSLTGFLAVETVIGGPVVAAAVVSGSVGAYAVRVFQARLAVAAAGLIALAQPLAVVLALGWDTISRGVHPSQMAVAGYVMTGLVGTVGLVLSGGGPRIDKVAALSQIRASIPYAPLSYANHLAGLVDRLVVSVVLGPAALGIYQAASILAEGPLRLLKGGISFFVSAYGRAAARGEDHGIRLQRLSLRLWTTYAAGVAGVLIGGADGIVSVYGSFGVAVAPLRILAAGLIPSAVALTLLTAGAGSGRLSALWIARLGIPVQVILGVILSARMGVIGMAIAQVATTVPAAIVQMYWSRDPSLSLGRDLGLRLVAVALVVPILSYLAQLVPIHWVLRAAGAAAICLALAAAMLTGTEERAIVRQLAAFWSPRPARGAGMSHQG